MESWEGHLINHLCMSLIPPSFHWSSLFPPREEGARRTRDERMERIRGKDGKKEGRMEEFHIGMHPMTTRPSLLACSVSWSLSFLTLSTLQFWSQINNQESIQDIQDMLLNWTELLLLLMMWTISWNFDWSWVWVQRNWKVLLPTCRFFCQHNDLSLIKAFSFLLSPLWTDGEVF